MVPSVVPDVLICGSVDVTIVVVSSIEVVVMESMGRVVACSGVVTLVVNRTDVVVCSCAVVSDSGVVCF